MALRLAGNGDSLIPKSIQALPTYNTRKFWSDLAAGVTVGFVALPLAMAFAISSGVSPQAGIYCAIVAGFIISALGGSWLRSEAPRAPLWSWWRESCSSTVSTGSSCARCWRASF